MNPDYCLGAYDFDLPDHLIAQHPPPRRDLSRMMIVPREAESVRHARFSEIEHLLKPNDLVIINDSKVIRARLVGRRASGGRVEILLLKPLGAEDIRHEEHRQKWAAFVRPAGRVKVGEVLEGLGQLEVVASHRDGSRWVLELGASIPISRAIAAEGSLPLPPYIRRPRGIRPEDDERYQTVYARQEGSVAAPTAGLHFTSALLEKLSRRGVRIGRVTLHVGAGTFAPVRHEDLREHAMHAEPFIVPSETQALILRTKRAGGRIIAVGTTSVRVLESIAGRMEAYLHNKELEREPLPQTIVDETSLFIYPGFHFRLVDVMITNFHLPRSSLLMLVSAFAGRKRMLRTYETAVKEGYRFFSYGDCQWIERREREEYGTNDF